MANDEPHVLFQGSLFGTPAAPDGIGTFTLHAALGTQDVTAVDGSGEDGRKVWIRDHAGQSCTILSRNGMQLRLQHADGTESVAITLEGVVL